LAGRRYLPDLVFWLLQDRPNFHDEEVVEFLKRLRQRTPCSTVIWDRNQIHRWSKAGRDYLAERPEIVAEDLPGYAPELNPDELVWCWVKYGRLCTYAAPDPPPHWSPLCRRRAFAHRVRQAPRTRRIIHYVPGVPGRPPPSRAHRGGRRLFEDFLR
jgi:hypothetical protein